MATIERPQQQLRHRHQAPSHAAPTASQVQPPAGSVELTDSFLSQASASSSEASAQQRERDAAAVQLQSMYSSPVSAAYSSYPELSREGVAASSSLHYRQEGIASPSASTSVYHAYPEPSAPSYEEMEMTEEQPGRQQQQERQPLMAPQYAQQQQHDASSVPRTGRPIVQTQNGPRPLSPTALARLEHLRAKARMAEAREAATEAARKRGALPAEEVEPTRLVQHVVKAGDDLTELAVAYGSSVASIRAANRKLVFEQCIDNVIGETILIPATRGPEALAQMDPAVAAEAEKRNRESETRASEEEARYYLEDCEWNMGAALAQFRDDVAWEKEQQKGGAGGKSQPMHANSSAGAGSKRTGFGASRLWS